MRYAILAALLAGGLVGCGDERSGADEQVDDTAMTGEAVATPAQATPTPAATVPMTVSLGQALRCSRIADFAIDRPNVLIALTSQQARSIALRAKSAAYSEGAKQDLTPAEIDTQEYKVYLGVENPVRINTGAIFNSDYVPSEAERAEAAEDQRRHQERVAKLEPELGAELTEICAPLFLQ